MLAFNLDGDVLEVCETMFSATTTTRRYFYYNLRTKMVSSHGRKGDVPDRQMDAGQETWVRIHYLPKVGLKDFP